MKMLKICAKKRKAYLIRFPDTKIPYGKKYRPVATVINDRKRTAEIRKKQPTKTGRRRSLIPIWGTKEKRNEYARIYARERKKADQKYYEETKKIQRRYYKKHREYLLSQKREYYRNCEPVGIIHTAINDFRSNKISIDEFNQRVNRAIERANDFSIEDGRSRRKLI